MTLLRVFPGARFIVLARDPRGLCWSRHSWTHATSASPERRFSDVAHDTARLATCVREFGDRSVVVRYEQLCASRGSACREICDFLDIEYQPEMVEYGRSGHDEGCGDESTLDHNHPHTASIDRWQAPDGLSIANQTALLEPCSIDLAELGMGGLVPIEPAKRSA